MNIVVLCTFQRIVIEHSANYVVCATRDCLAKMPLQQETPRSSRAIAPFDLEVRTVRVPAHEMYISVAWC